MTEDMTLAEFRDALRALELEIGRKAEIAVHAAWKNDADLLSATIYSRGIGRDSNGRVKANTFRGLIDAMRVFWAKRRGEVEAKTITDMALAIIRLTHEQGACTDAALRQEFDAETVKRYGAEAVKRADEMADNGPFRIVALAGANAA